MLLGKLHTYLLDHGQHPWLRIVVSVGSNTQIDLLRIRVSAVGGHQAKERVLWSLRADICAERRGRRAISDWTHLA